MSTTFPSECNSLASQFQQENWWASLDDSRVLPRCDPRTQRSPAFGNHCYSADVDRALIPSSRKPFELEQTRRSGGALIDPTQKRRRWNGCRPENLPANSARPYIKLV